VAPASTSGGLIVPRRRSHLERREVTKKQEVRIMKSRRSTTFRGVLTAVALGGLILLGGKPAQAHDPRLDEAQLALQKARALLLAAEGGTAELPPKIEQKVLRRLERAIDLILSAMDQIDTAGEIVDDALGTP
jgi:hypothetical protein